VSGLLFNFSRYLSYRLRLVSISCDPSFIFSIDGHNLTVIEADSTSVQPLVVDSLQIFAGACVDYFDFLVVLIDGKIGQRYSVVVCTFLFSSHRKVYLNWLQLTADQPIDNYCEFLFSLIRRLMKRNQGFALSHKPLVAQIQLTTT
jgi:hypothetical protein